MNNNYTQNPMFPEAGTQIGTPLESYNTPNQQTAPNLGDTNINSNVYNENIFTANIGKMATFYMTFTGSVEWRDKAFTGIIEEAGRDHVLISDPKTGKWTLLVLIYLNYVEFDEAVNYPFNKIQPRIR